jgi:flavin-dependent dehydrogenase
MRSRFARYDTIVVGGRVAGAATAMLLAQQGQRVLVLERGTHGSDTLSTHALMRGGVLQLERWGVLGDIVDAGTPPVHATTFHYPDESIVVDLKEPLYAPRRTVLDAALIDAAWDAGVDVQFSTRVNHLVTGLDGRVTGVAGTDARGQQFWASADLVVGADGIRSVVARAAGARVERTGFFAMASIYGYWSDIDTTGYEWVYGLDRAAGFIPTNDGQTCVFVGLTPKQFAAAKGNISAAYLDALARVPQLHDRLAGAHPPARLRSFPGMRGYMRQAAGPGWALVGDAGYFKDPTTAHGITDALRDAELLSRAVVSNTLADYQAERDRLSTKLFALTDAIASFQWNLDELRQLLLALSGSMRHEVAEIERWDDRRVAYSRLSA